MTAILLGGRFDGAEFDLKIKQIYISVEVKDSNEKVIGTVVYEYKEIKNNKIYYRVLRNRKIKKI